MSDSAPAKKVGSLRDRIAMFDKKDDAPAPAPAPAGPRGKLGAWKPKPIEREPVASNEGLNKPEYSGTVGASESKGASDDSAPPVAPERSVGGGMSAADARESIAKGGAMSMKERMAALAGKGGFGGPPPPVPAAAKPAFKRAPVSHDADEDHPQEPSAADDGGESHVDTTSHEAPETAPNEEEAEGEPVEKSEEELERERRAAIAARMARLGGTRVGMAPAFGRPAVPTASKPPRKPSHDSAPEPKHSEEAPAAVDPAKLDEEPAPAKDADYNEPPAATEQPVEPPKHIDLPEQSLPPTEVPLPPSAAASPPTTFSLPATSHGSTPATSPPSMPMPAVPKRALPPRKKAAKATTPAATPKSDVSEPALGEQPAAPPAESEERTIEPRPTLEADAPAASELSTTTISHAPLPESVVEAREDESHEPPTQHTEAHAAANLVDVDEEKRYDDDEPAAPHKPKDSEAHAAASLVDVESDQRTREEDEMKERDELTAAEQVKRDAEDEDTEPFTAHAVHSKDVPALPEEKEYVEDIVTPHALEEASPAEPAEAEAEEDEAARRRRIAEKMAKMGGVGMFGGPRPVIQQHTAPSADDDHKHEQEEEVQDDEEDEDARRARIAERLARSGGRSAFSPPVPSAPRPNTIVTDKEEAPHQSTDIETTTRPHAAKEQAQDPEEGGA